MLVIYCLIICLILYPQRFSHLLYHLWFAYRYLNFCSLGKNITCLSCFASGESSAWAWVSAERIISITCPYCLRIVGTDLRRTRPSSTSRARPSRFISPPWGADGMAHLLWHLLRSALYSLDGGGSQSHKADSESAVAPYQACYRSQMAVLLEYRAANYLHFFPHFTLLQITFTFFFCHGQL